MSKHAENRKISVLDIIAKKEKGEKIVMLTAYDFPAARSLRTKLA
ncbi:MAG: hypothetical protein R3C26_23950 [Calditrichia bacterium]